MSWRSWCGGLLASLWIASTTTWALPAQEVIERDGWSYDRANIHHSDPSKIAEKKQKGVLNQLTGWAEYDFEVKQSGWFELLLRGGVPGWGRDVFVDGKRIICQSTTGQDDMISKGVYKETNWFLTAGKHTLRIRRLNFPGVLPDGWELRSSDGKPEGCIFARIDGHSIVRAGESVKLSVTGGAPQATSYELKWVDNDGNAVSLQTLEFPASAAAVTKVIEIPCTTQGIFHVEARLDGRPLRPDEFRAGPIVVVDTKAAPAAADVKQVQLHDIDCVAQTDNGQPLAKDVAFWEAWGETRISSCVGGKYREGGDGLDPSIPLPPKKHAGKMRSGFSYAIDVPEAQVPYIVQIDYPDDDRRTVNVIILEKSKKSNGLDYPAAQLGSGYETGDHYTLTNGMLTHQVLFWPSTTELRVALVSMNPGMRAAAARIRVYKLEGGIPMAAQTRPDGRLMAAWTEEPGRWRAYFRTSNFPTDIERDVVGIERYCQMVRYAGYNAISPTEAVYQGMTYHSDELEGWFVRAYDCPRIMALMCEKYGLRYIPELHISGQAWFHREVVEKLAADPEELYIHSRLGTSGRSGNWFCGTWNALHPAIQQKYIDIVGELADKVGDSPAFAGFSSRLMTWVWQSWNGLPSLNWGYGDWTVAQFEKDTGIKVPGALDDPDRFSKRFDFLTADNMREKWLSWRCNRMLDYYRRLRDRIRQVNPNAVLYLPYYGDAEQGMDLIFGSYLQTEQGALREAGIDTYLLRLEPGIAVVPQGGFGRRNSSPVSDADIYAKLYDPEHVGLGHGYERGFGYGNAYFEDHTAIPIDKLGLPELEPGAYCGAAEAGGRNMLEKFSVVLAAQDTNFMRIGGLGYTFGQPQYYHPWLQVYENLPAVPFQPAFTLGAVSAWQADADGATWFYVVNRSPSPNWVPISCDAKVKSVTDVLTGEQVANGKQLRLAAYELRAFKAPKGVRFAAAVDSLAWGMADRQAYSQRQAAARSLLAFDQLLMDKIARRPQDYSIGSQLGSTATGNLIQAWDAERTDDFPSLRASLSTPAFTSIYQQLAVWPKDLLHRKQPLTVLHTVVTGNTGIAGTPMLDAAALQAAVTGGKTALVDGTTYDPEWTFTQVLNCADSVAIALDVPAPGRYQLSLGHVAASYGAIQAMIGDQAMANLAQTADLNQPDTTVFPVVSLPAGKTTLALTRRGTFGIYGVTLQPVYTPLPSPLWATIGPFPTPWTSRHPEHVKEAMDRVDPPMQGVDVKATYTGAEDKQVRWQWSDEVRGGVPHFTPAAGVSFLFRNKVQERHVCYAATVIEAPSARDAELLIGCDWWGNAYLNGQKVISERPRKLAEEDGCEFNGWRPTLARIHLKAGRNVLVVKCHGGTVANWFTAYISNPGDLKIAPPAKP